MRRGGGVIRLYDTLTRAIEPVASQGPAIRVYVCGITPYDTTHLGHAFTYSCADLLVRTLEARRGRVRYVQNITDIDDDILRRAGQLGEEWRRLGNRWTEHYIRDMIALNVRPPDHLPRASQTIPEIRTAIRALLDAGLAYLADGSVYYDLRTRPDYGKLSRLDPAEMLTVANERGNVPNDPLKRQPLDFVLWQASRPGEPAWPSPWGPGRPGWHIECSSMVQKFLGDSLEIHAGGEDLVFPHHESEIAQIEPLTGRPFARHWMHVSMVHHGGAKMSKSLGNLVMVSDLLGRWPADALRAYLASHHYRSPWGHSEIDLARAADLAERLRAAAVAAEGRQAELEFGHEAAEFDRRMEDDLDSPGALSVLDGLANRILQAGGRARLAAAQAGLRAMAAQLGLHLDRDGPEPRVAEGWQARHREFLESTPAA